MLAKEPAARDFVADAFAHMKFIGYVEAAMTLLEKAGVQEGLDDGCIALEGPEACSPFIETCRQRVSWSERA